MKKLFFLLLVVSFISCQQSSKSIITSNQKDVPNSLAKNTIAADLEMHESGYTPYLLFDNLTSPEGITVFPKTREVLVGQSRISDIVAFKNQGDVRQFAEIPFDRVGLVDLLYDPLRGVFVTSIFDCKVSLINKNGAVTEFSADLNYPLFMEMDSKHNLYVSEFYGSQIAKFDLFGNKTIVIDFKENLDWRPRGIVFDRDENLYVLSCWKQKEIRKFDLHNASSFPIPLSNGELIASLEDIYSPQDITFGFGGDLFVLDSNELFRVKLNGQVSKFVSGLMGSYNTITSTLSGNLIFTDYGFGEDGAGKVYSIKR
jgi:DNA-binding beta-propeller fold protein YncE